MSYVGIVFSFTVGTMVSVHANSACNIAIP